MFPASQLPSIRIQRLDSGPAFFFHGRMWSDRERNGVTLPERGHRRVRRCAPHERGVRGTSQPPRVAQRPAWRGWLAHASRRPLVSTMACWRCSCRRLRASGTASREHAVRCGVCGRAACVARRSRARCALRSSTGYTASCGCRMVLRCRWPAAVASGADAALLAVRRCSCRASSPRCVGVCALMIARMTAYAVHELCGSQCDAYGDGCCADAVCGGSRSSCAMFCSLRRGRYRCVVCLSSVHVQCAWGSAAIRCDLLRFAHGCVWCLVAVCICHVGF